MSLNTPPHPVRLRTRPASQRGVNGVSPSPSSTEEHAVQLGEAAGVGNGIDRAVSSNADSEAYAVGYKKPPFHTRFKPGICPNPKGRPKGAKDIRTRVLEAGNEKVVVRENGRVKKMSKIDIGIRKALNKFAETGNLKHMETLLKLEGLGSGGSSGPRGDEFIAKVEKPDLELLQWFLDQHAANSNPGGEGA